MIFSSGVKSWRVVAQGAEAGNDTDLRGLLAVFLRIAKPCFETINHRKNLAQAQGKRIED
jgi:hypothetical protein